MAAHGTPDPISENFDTPLGIIRQPHTTRYRGSWCGSRRRSLLAALHPAPGVATDRRRLCLCCALYTCPSVAAQAGVVTSLDYTPSVGLEVARQMDFKLGMAVTAVLEAERLEFVITKG